MILGALLASRPLQAEEELPPPPESTDSLPSIDEAASAGAELPPPPDPGAPAEPELSAEAPDLSEAPPDATSVETPPGEEIPSLPMEGDGDPKDLSADNLEVPSDAGLTDVPVMDQSLGATEFSSSTELSNLAMKDRIKSKELVLWLSLGPSYGTLTNKGSYATATTVAGANDAVGGLGYNAGIGFMLDSVFQLQFDFTGTPKTRNSTVDHAMFGFGPRLGFLTLMGIFGVQAGPDPTNSGTLAKIFSIGARAGLDLVLSHPKDSRVSIGLAPEVFYITPQGADGYNSAGVSVSLRIYGYENAF